MFDLRALFCTEFAGSGRDHHPEMATLAVAAGIGELTSWTPLDAPDYRLRVVARNATVIIDAVNSASVRAQLTRMVLPPPIITLEHPEQPLPALTDFSSFAAAPHRASTPTCATPAR
jgi:hypothetical protein